MGAESDGSKFGPRVEELHKRVDYGAQEGRAIGEADFLEAAFQRCAKLLDALHGNSIDNRLLVGKEAVKRADGDSGVLRDTAGCDVFERDAAEQPGSRLKDVMHRLLTALLNRAAARSAPEAFVLLLHAFQISARYFDKSP